MILLKLIGKFFSSGQIILNPLKSIQWEDLSDSHPPYLPDNFRIELSLTFDENDFLLGNDGIVWATYDSRQAEIIRSSLIAQQINSEIIKLEFATRIILLLQVTQSNDIKAATDFIWKNSSGLRLTPDWNYSSGETNKSFEVWLNGN